MDTSARRSGWGAAALLAACCVAFHWRTIGFGLYLDDHWLVRSWSAREVAETFVSEFDPSGFNPPYFRPLGSVSFAVDAMVWGSSVRGPHVTNLALHVVAVLLVHRLALRLGLRGWVSFAAAAYFAVVPSNVATVVYVAHRTDAMVAIGILAGLLLVGRHHVDRRPRSLVGLVGAAVFALLSKEVALAVVPMVAVWWWFLRVEARALADSLVDDAPAVRWATEPRRWWEALTERDECRGWTTVLLPLTVLCVAYLVYRAAVLPPGALLDRFAETQGPVRALLGGVSSVVEGVPWELRGWAIGPLAVLTVCALVLAPRSRGWRVVLLGGGLLVGGVVPLVFSGGVEPRLLYVAQIGMAVALAGVLSAFDEAVRDIGVDGAGRRALAAAAAAGLAGLAVLTVVLSVRSQDLFAEGSSKQRQADAVVLGLPSVADHVPTDRLAELRRRADEALSP